MLVGDDRRSAGGGLIHDEQNLSVVSELAERRSRSCFVVGQSAIQKPLSPIIQFDGMVRSLAYVDSDEDSNAVMLLNVSHALPQSSTTNGPANHGNYLRIHVTGDLGMIRIQPQSAITSCRPAPDRG